MAPPRRIFGDCRLLQRKPLLIPMRERPPFVRNVTEFKLTGMKYPGDQEEMSLGATLSRSLGLSRIGVNYEILKPGTRTSWPHAEEVEEEFIFVLAGAPDLWVNGETFPLSPGDCVAFPPGTGIAHSFLNNSAEETRLLVIGERIEGNRVFYPFRPEGWEGMPEAGRWTNPPRLEMGPHDGVPDKLKGGR
jgi:uncharacterized cupin superfamily protein